MRILLPLVFLAPSLLLLAPPAGVDAGPPCICWELDPGEHATLPARSGDAPPRSLEVVERTLQLLSPNAPAIARMETIRRAALTLAERPQAAGHLLRRLMARALDAAVNPQAQGAPAFFDAGYAVEAWKQMGLEDELEGYAWIAHALKLRPEDAQMHLGAALVALMPGHVQTETFGDHWARAHAGAAKDPLLARNLKRVAAQGEHLLKRKGVTGSGAAGN